MKKCFKMLGTMAVAAALSMSAFTMVNADTTTYTITINDAKDAENSITGNTYTLYKVADFDVSGGVYTNIKTTTAYTSLQGSLEELAGKVNDSSDAVTFANSAASYIAYDSAKDTVTVSENSKSFSVTETGYYLVVDTAHAAANPYLATKYILVAVDGLNAERTSADTTENIYVKTSKAGVTKKIVSDHGTGLIDANTVAIGDTITYQLESSIPTYDATATNIKYYLTDVMSAGLTYSGIKSVQVSAGGTEWTNADYNTNGSDEVNTAGAKVIINLTNASQIIQNTRVKVILTATLNENANTGTSGNPNSVDLTYSNNYFGGDDSYTTPEDTVITYTGALEIEKVDSTDTSVKLSGAKFTIYRAATSDEINNDSITKATIKIGKIDTPVIAVRTDVTTAEYGKAAVTGLAVGTYYAVETEAPSGYSIDTTPILLDLTVEGTETTLTNHGDAGTGDTITNYDATNASNANSSVVTNYPVSWYVNKSTVEGASNSNIAQITNKKGISLPGTGGIGTTIFTFGGLALVLVAAVMFIVYIKKQKKQA